MKVVNLHWHEALKQEKWSSLAPPRGILEDLAGCQINPMYVNFYLQKSLDIFDKN